MSSRDGSREVVSGGWRRVVPWSMVGLRWLLAPVMVLGTLRGWDGRVLALLVLVALIDDIYDGMLARRWGTETSGLRLADSTADTVFYLGVALALWLRVPEVLRRNGWLLVVLFGIEIVRYAYDFWKFGKGASYHSYLAKAWGLVLASAVIGVLGFDALWWLLRVSIWMGIAANVEGLAMSVVLPRWRNDVTTLPSAWRLGREMRRGL